MGAPQRIQWPQLSPVPRVSIDLHVARRTSMISRHEGVFLAVEGNGLTIRDRQEGSVCVPARTLPCRAETDALGTEGLVCVSGGCSKGLYSTL